MAEISISKDSSRSERRENSPRILFAGGGFSVGNLGVAAMTRGNLRSIVRSWPEVDIFLFDYGVGPEVDSRECKIEGKEYTIERLLFRFSKKISLRNNIFRIISLTLLTRALPLPLRLKRMLLGSSMSLEMMSSTDLICSIAGGDSFSDTYGFRQLLYVSMPVLLGLALKKPVILLPQTYGPFKGRPAKILARFILRRAKLMYSRDHDGLKVIEELTGLPCKRAHFAYDMGFGLEALPPELKLLAQIENIKRRGPVVGLNVSGLLCMSNYDGKNMFGLQSNYSQLLNALLQDLIVRKQQQVILIPHVLGGGGPEGESDDSACERLFASAKERFGERVHYLQGPFDHHTTKYLIGQCDFFVGARMHACIGALSQFVPTVALAYSNKFIGVLNSIGVGDLVVDLRHTNEQDVLAKMDEIFSRRQMIRQQLHERMTSIQESVLSFFSREEICRIIG